MKTLVGLFLAFLLIAIPAAAQTKGGAPARSAPGVGGVPDPAGPTNAGVDEDPASTMLLHTRTVQLAGSDIVPEMARVRQKLAPMAEPVTLGVPGWAALPSGLSEIPGTRVQSVICTQAAAPVKLMDPESHRPLICRLPIGSLNPSGPSGATGALTSILPKRVTQDLFQRGGEPSAEISAEAISSWLWEGI